MNRNKINKLLTIILAVIIYIFSIFVSNFFTNYYESKQNIILTVIDSHGTCKHCFGKLPNEASDDILKTLKSCKSIEVKDPPIVNHNSVQLSFNDDVNQLLTVYDNSYAEYKHDDKSEYYKMNSYYKIVEIVANYLPFCDWEAICYSSEIGDIFKEFSNDIILGNTPVYGFDSWISIYSDDVYSVFVDKYGKITIFYENEYGGTPTITYLSTPDFYEKLKPFAIFT